MTQKIGIAESVDDKKLSARLESSDGWPGYRAFITCNKFNRSLKLRYGVLVVSTQKLFVILRLPQRILAVQFVRNA